MRSNVESLATWAGPVTARGYVWRNGAWVEFALTDGGFAWVDNGEDGVRRESFNAETWDFYFV